MIKLTRLEMPDDLRTGAEQSFPRERLDPENLVLACAVFNNTKGDFWDDANPLLNPFTDDPDEEILA